MVTITIAITDEAYAAVSPGLESRGNGDASQGVTSLLANVAAEYARGIQSGIVRPQLAGASTQEQRRSLITSITTAATAAQSDVLASGAVTVEVE